MLVVVQDFRSGELSLVDAPVPRVDSGGLLVRNCFSFISPGTELASIRFARKSLLGKAVARRDLLGKVLAKIKREGLLAAVKAAMLRLKQPLPLGYSSAGVVEEVGEGVAEFRVGDRVACAGIGYASHAEVVSVPKNLTVKVPDNLPLKDASTVALGAIAIEAYRIADAHLGETVVLLGLGVIGQILLQILRGAGCRVIGYDIDERRVGRLRDSENADAFSDVDELALCVETTTGGSGADCVIVTAATEGNEPVELAPQLLRKRGIVVIVGDTGLNIPRKPYYEKELQLRFSTSYGPGRYDAEYELYGRDYPVAYARWTERRNMEAYLRLIAAGVVKLDALLKEEYRIEDALKAYELLDKGRLRSVVLRYEKRKEESGVVQIATPVVLRKAALSFGMIGAGLFARSVLIPELIELNARPSILCTKTPAKSATYAKRYGFEKTTSDAEAVINSDADFVVIATPHSEHSPLLAKALKKGKPVFCEKPLAIDEEGLKTVIDAYKESRTPFMVGFNRRFAPAIEAIRERFSSALPMFISYIVNAGRIDGDHWILQPQQGGRIVGEVCHFVDTCIYLADSEVESIYAVSADRGDVYNDCAVTLHFKNSSIAQIIYSAYGSPIQMKERIEIHRAGKTSLIEDFHTLILFDRKKRKTLSFGRNRKGHKEELAHFIRALRGERDLKENIRSAFLTTVVTLSIITSIRTSVPIKVQRIEVEE